MRTALLVEHRKPLVVAEVEPEPLTYGQVLVRILASGICGAQLAEIDGTKQSGQMPHPLGHEGCGIVEEIGPAVTSVRPGDKVCIHWRKGYGIESDFPSYRYNGRTITSGKVTTFGTHAVVSENRVTTVPKATPVELSALLGCGLSTALGTIEEEANLKMGESILIIGCGGLGLNLIRAARMRRASVICGTDVANKSQSAISAGADSWGLYEKGKVYEGGFKFDVVVDTTGNDAAITSGLNALAPSGRFIMVGQPSSDVTIRNAVEMFEGEGKTIKATQGGRFRPDKDIPRYVRLYESGQLDLQGIITHRVSLDDINAGIDLVRFGEAGRVLIEP